MASKIKSNWHVLCLAIALLAFFLMAYPSKDYLNLVYDNESLGRQSFYPEKFEFTQSQTGDVIAEKDLKNLLANHSDLTAIAEVLEYLSARQNGIAIGTEKQLVVKLVNKNLSQGDGLDLINKQSEIIYFIDYSGVKVFQHASLNSPVSKTSVFDIWEQIKNSSSIEEQQILYSQVSSLGKVYTLSPDGIFRIIAPETSFHDLGNMQSEVVAVVSQEQYYLYNTPGSVLNLNDSIRADYIELSQLDYSRFQFRQLRQFIDGYDSELYFLSLGFQEGNNYRLVTLVPLNFAKVSPLATETPTSVPSETSTAIPECTAVSCQPPNSLVCNQDVCLNGCGYICVTPTETPTETATHTPTQEICNNGGDDDGDGSADCSDSDCSGTENCNIYAQAPEINFNDSNIIVSCGGGYFNFSAYIPVTSDVTLKVDYNNIGTDYSISGQKSYSTYLSPGPHYIELIASVNGTSAISYRYVQVYENCATETPTEVPTEAPTYTPIDTPTETPTDTPAETPTVIPTVTTSIELIDDGSYTNSLDPVFLVDFGIERIQFPTGLTIHLYGNNRISGSIDDWGLLSNNYGSSLSLKDDGLLEIKFSIESNGIFERYLQTNHNYTLVINGSVYNQDGSQALTINYSDGNGFNFHTNDSYNEPDTTILFHQFQVRLNHPTPTETPIITVTAIETPIDTPIDTPSPTDTPIDTQTPVETATPSPEPTNNTDTCGDGTRQSEEECDGDVNHGWCTNCIVFCDSGYDKVSTAWWIEWNKKKCTAWVINPPRICGDSPGSCPDANSPLDYTYVAPSSDPDTWKCGNTICRLPGG